MSPIAPSALPTVAHFRQHGCAGVRVGCTRCGRGRGVTFETIRAAEHETIRDLARRPYRCSGCGSTETTVMPDWPSGTAGGLSLVPASFPVARRSGS